MQSTYLTLSVLKNTCICMHKTPGALRGSERVISRDVVMKNHFFSDFLSTLLLDCLYNLPSTPTEKGGTDPAWPVL